MNWVDTGLVNVSNSLIELKRLHRLHYNEGKLTRIFPDISRQVCSAVMPLAPNVRTVLQVFKVQIAFGRLRKLTASAE